MNLKEALQSKLSEKEMKYLRTGFDAVGSIAIIEIPKELVKKEKLIAQTILNLNNSIRTIAKKVGRHTGKFRTQKIKIIAGEKNKVTEYKESGCRFKLDVEKCYFSPRLSHERLRIVSQVKEGENILVMFSGIGPYPIVLAKNSPAQKIIGVELNPTAHKYAVENVKLNKFQEKISLYKGDVKKIISKLKKTHFDRMIMPLPKDSTGFLKEAFSVAKRGTIVHFYTFAKENKFDDAKKKVLNSCKKLKHKIKILNTVKAGQTAPREFRICIDFEVL